jgi:hypothetical protein
MANGGANISRGLGRGAAQVYDTSSPVNMYARLMQQQQLKRAAETKALTDELGKVTPEGIRQPDVKGFIDQYGKWRDKSIEANAERNPTRKAILSQEAEREKLATLMYKDDSKNELRNEQDRNKMLLDPNVRDRYDDSVIERVLKSSSLAKDDPNYVRNMNQFQIRPDLSKLTKDLDDLDKNLLQSSQWSAPITEKAKQGNIEGVYVYNTRAVDPKAQATAYASLFDLDRKFQAGLREMFPDLADLPKEQLKAQAIPLLVQQRVRTESSKPDFQANDNWREKQLANDRLIRARKSEGDAEEESTYRQQIVRGIMNNDKESIDEMRAYLPSGSKVDYRTSNPTKTSKGGYNLIRVDIPAVLDVDGTIKKPGVVEDISLSLGDAKNRLNSILSEYTGEKISPSKLNIKGGKPRGEQIEIKGQEKTNKPESTVNEYTGITTVKDAKGNSFQIGVKDGKWYNIKTGKIYQ